MSHELQQVMPVLPVRDVAAALALYAQLGFETRPYVDGDGKLIYGFATWGPVMLHLSLVPGIDPEKSVVSCYIAAADADGLHDRWQAAGLPGRLTAPADMPYGIREFCYIDPDGNLLRFGTPIQSCR